MRVGADDFDAVLIQPDVALADLALSRTLVLAAIPIFIPGPELFSILQFSMELWLSFPMVCTPHLPLLKIFEFKT